MSHGLILAIETSQHRGGVALRDPGSGDHVEMLQEARRHDDDLMPAIDRLMKRAGRSASDLRGGAVGVSVGPGGFSGLRIAVSTAKMFAETLRVRLLAVPTAMVIAESHLGEGPIIVALASKGETYWETRLDRDPESRLWRIVGQPGIIDAARINVAGFEALLGDSYLPAEARRRCEATGVPVVEPRLEPLACLAVAARMLAAGMTTDPLHLSPLYPRVPEAVSIWDRNRGSAPPRQG